MRKTHAIKNKRLLVNIGIFMSFAAFSFLSFTLLSPIVPSNAETADASAGNAFYTVSISVDNVTPIRIASSSTQEIYTGASEITYTNTCPAGFNVSVSSSSDTTSLTRNGNDDERKTIPTINSGTSLEDNTWGYSVDSGNTYHAIPDLDEPANLFSTSSANTTPATFDVTYGIKTDNNLPSGRYIGGVIYTVSVKPECLTYSVDWDFADGEANPDADYPSSINFGELLDLSTLIPTRPGYDFIGWSNGSESFGGTDNGVNINPNLLTSITMTAQWESSNGDFFSIDEMQEMTPYICSTATTPAASATQPDLTGAHKGDNSYVPTRTLEDTRDGNTYTVKKLADGSCWMTESLRIANKTISSADSNLPEGETWTIPASSKSGFSAQNTNNVYIDETYGGYYTFYTATAGWGTDSITSETSSKDICPKGWHLPIGGSSGEFASLYDKYNSSSSIRGTPGFVHNGFALSGSVSSQGITGSYWSATSRSTNGAYYLAIDLGGEEGVNAAISNVKYFGHSVRCVSDPFKKMQEFDVGTLGEGESIMLEDIRNNKIYTVKRLEDGKVWMTDNLSINNQTISSADSNLPSGETFTIANSSPDEFASSLDADHAYVDPTYGGYYTFYSATAGWGAQATGAGTSPKDICPKGWRLPTGDELDTFDTIYDGRTGLMITAANIIWSGYINSAGQGLQEEAGFLWSSTIRDEGDYPKMLQIGRIDTIVNIAGRDIGFSIRCVAKERNLGDITYMQDMNPTVVSNTEIGSSKTLIDRRDNNTYTVKKLTDGKIWMTQNLRIINKTISSADSNLSEGETWTIPASSTSGYSSSNNNNAYYDSTYGGYYSFYTATAGWGSTSSTSGNAPRDICPKNWRLPTGGPSGEYKTLYGYYNSLSSMTTGEPGFVFAGRLGRGSMMDRGYVGSYWSSTAISGTGAYGVDLYSTSYNANWAPTMEAGYDNYYGFAVRCIAI